MLTKLCINNFKKLDHIEIELGKAVVLIGPNNSGKTSALQALALWDIGQRLWRARRNGTVLSAHNPGVTINRRDLIPIPVPVATLLWRDLILREVKDADGGVQNKNILIDIGVEGVHGGKQWSCGFEFDYANEESFYCRPLRLSDEKPPQRMPVPEEASKLRVAYLPPMSGLASVEPKWEPGRINVLLGEGQTAQVLRNLCYQILERTPENWEALVKHIRVLFGVELQPPEYIQERGEITMDYRDLNGVRLDLSSSGRGLQQTLLLLAHLYANPGTVLLLDEPDAHLEVLRQQQIYKLITDIADAQGSQIIAASHSEVILNEAADRDIVIAFVGKPHRIDDRGSQVVKSLREIGFEHYYKAEQCGWVLYLEGSTDLAILQAFAETLSHPAAADLERPFFHYVANQPMKALSHFEALREAKGDLAGVAIYDRLERTLPPHPIIDQRMWKRRELENYLCRPDVLMAYARHDLPDDIFGYAEVERRLDAMRESIEELESASKVYHKPGPWTPDIKATDEFLDPLFENFFMRLELPNLLRKTDYHILARLVPAEEIDPEITEALDAIHAVAGQAKPRIDY